MKVCIAEKPSVAREIATIIGARQRHDGYYEGNGYQVTWTFGHLCELKLPDDYKAHWKKWDLRELPMMPDKFETKVKKDKGVKKQFGIVKKLFKKASVVINCGDAGQEGELIQRWVMKEANYKGPVQRLWISSLTPEAIKDGFNNLRNGSEFDNLYYAGSSRAVGDWLLGMNATRLFTLKYGGYKQVLSIGRVQTPTLSMVVDRWKEIANFKPEPYWELHTIYREVDFHYEKGRFQKKEDGQQLLEKVTGAPFTILKVDQKEGKEYAPRLFDLTSLQVHCNKRFSYTADQTLKLVQQLYEQKVVTYPRVDTTFLPNDVYPKVSGILGKMQQYSQFTQPLLGKKLRKSTKVFDDKKVTDHHAIIPTGMEKSLPANLQNVYDAIARRFIAVFYPDCIVNKTVVIGEAAEIKFKATGKEILKPGWRMLFPSKGSGIRSQGSSAIDNSTSKTQHSKSAKDENILPPFKVGESGEHLPELQEKMTQPPKHYTEATLLRAMETAGKKVDNDELRDLMKANGIGRPSTRANIIETLFRRKYLKRNKKQVLATETGIQLIDVIDNELLKSPELTGQWEKQLGDIAKGEHRPQQFVHDMKVLLTKLVEEVKGVAVARKIGIQKPGHAAGKSTTPVSRQTTRSTSKTRTRKAKSSIVGHSCPKCQQGQLLKGNSAYGCGRYKAGCDFRLPFSFMGKKVPERQLLRLLEQGTTIQLKGFKKEKVKMDGQVKFDDNFGLLLRERSDRVAARSATPVRSQTTSVSEPSTNSKLKTQNPKLSNAKLTACPKCQKGQILKGKTAYGCSRYKEGCDFRFAFDEIRKRAAGKELTRELVFGILHD